jgi:hypothetical protein
MDVGYPYILLQLLSFPSEEDIRDIGEKKLSTLTVSNCIVTMKLNWTLLEK